ncbi:CAP domain-containing protein [Actinoplanes regularis]|uniref:Uncharacterized conserved protein YkwD, contains CAP (CSP/antigen 5/PR1) domain n=1 Tax=Actinoplanes regularis TaxID=52697 RepID=A0A238Y2I9_9ACTN|nr:CAP domain-containing protein [Actinoplanes regularis]GIE86265.1 hypothetical protein Are01nite_27450 [Actinoplanes regularis]SNR65028.1 Uncharacterized conserved protein YkwD, contains CAP (CSP/antigen 5/PR1) domain [Actinoplanes regularis]
MRKPLVVLAVAATALIAGGAVAARATAQEPPNDSAGFNVFGLPRLSGEDDVPETEPPASARSGFGAAEPDRTPAVTPSGTPSATPPGTPAGRPAAAPTGARPGSGAPQGPSARRSPVDLEPAGRRGRAVADPFAASHTTVTARSISFSPDSPVQQQILALVNWHRARAGCGQVTIDRRLIAAANRHAADMATRDYFEHESPNGERAGDRVSDTGYDWRWYGENIARGQDSPWAAMADWMNSPSHRSNILDCRLDQMGVGLAIDRYNTPYWVQDFATPR